MGRIENMARRDFRRISGDANGFATDILFENADGTMTATVNGLANKIHYSIDIDGHIGSSKTAHITVSEKALTDAGYTVRNVDHIVAIEHHRVSWADSTGLVKKYIIASTHPDETLGVLLIYLGDFK